MNFQDLKSVEKSDTYLDIAFSRAKKRIEEARSNIKEKDRVKKAKYLELIRIDTIESNLEKSLFRIIEGFPSIDNLDVFYVELIKLTLDIASLKKSLGSVNWAIKKVKEFSRIHRRRINKVIHYKEINKIRKEYYGRISSFLKQIKKYLEYLEEARKTMKNYPSIKINAYSVCLFGFPNAGKSTLLSKITPATPEIKEYAFTTKSINLGYITFPGNKIQIVDTPGTLNRINKMNNIELQAHLAMKHIAHLVVYVFDPTFHYSLKEQEKLLREAKKFDKPILFYLSKKELVEKEIVDEFKKKYEDIFDDYEELKKEIVKRSRVFLKEKREKRKLENEGKFVRE